MSLNLLPRYVQDSLRAYRACVGALGLAGADLDLFALIRAARSGAVDRRGELMIDDSIRLRYHVHGTGYSIAELDSGRQTHFDVCTSGENQCLRFSLWSLQQYAASIGEDSNRETLQEELRESNAGRSGLIHVTEGGSDYYCYPVPSERTDTAPICSR